MMENPAGKARILVVEDETIVALDIKQSLENMGYTVVALAVSGDQAIQRAESHRPDLVLMDIKLKGAMDGIETAAVIRSRFKIPVIFLTAFADEPTLRRARVTEAFGYILKPFEERELNVNIEIALYRHQMDQKLRESEERYDLAIRGSNDGLWDWNLKNGTIFYSPRWKEMLGFEDGEIGSNPDEWLQLIHPADLERFKLDLSNHLAGLSSHFQIEYRLRTRRDEYRWVMTRGLAVRDADGVAYRMAGSLSDITERKLAEEQLLHDAFHDALTGLPNRTLFLDRLQHAIDRAKRFSKDDFAVLFLDLDRFKIVNDSLGHQVGDKLLIAFAERLKKVLRSSDTLARLGGDEFVILLEWLGDPGEAGLISERIHEDLKQPFNLAGQNVFTSASIGIVSGLMTYDRPEDILRDADIAMYRAKSGGKARHVVFDTDLRDHAMTRLELEGALRSALGRDELKVYYQPIISLTSGKIIGFEALLRWFHPVRGLIAPDIFIPLAEETGLILPIGRWVLKKACQQLYSWQRAFPAEPPLSMSVNMSSRQLAQPQFIEQVEQILEETQVSPSAVKLEITESLLMDNSKSAFESLNRLRGMGIQLLVDDFGTGYSSLGYVQHLPIDTIKIDRVFINQMSMNDRHSEIAKTIVQLAAELGLETIAEGIETQEQLGMLRKLDCGYGQGWLFSKALSHEKIESLLENSYSFTQLEDWEAQAGAED